MCFLATHHIWDNKAVICYLHLIETDLMHARGCHTLISVPLRFSLFTSTPCLPFFPFFTHTSFFSFLHSPFPFPFFTHTFFFVSPFSISLSFLHLYFFIISPFPISLSFSHFFSYRLSSVPCKLTYSPHFLTLPPYFLTSPPIVPPSLLPSTLPASLLRFLSHPFSPFPCLTSGPRTFRNNR